ncbi:collagen alpha-1(I) chain-like isoform X4 [Canis lupus familiaris]|uniref:collagen alpha-1(I) chain-like isoform X4 n=1 Tax=Canis lupus familiaris TaxID=9615 RepID=UPI0018F29889|nr:collagen alpha-1(I) chain-like isoform X4 [Canis lupus familiaris]
MKKREGWVKARGTVPERERAETGHQQGDLTSQCSQSSQGGTPEGARRAGHTRAPTRRGGRRPGRGSPRATPGPGPRSPEPPASRAAGRLHPASPRPRSPPGAPRSPPPPGSPPARAPPPPPAPGDRTRSSPSLLPARVLAVGCGRDRRAAGSAAPRTPRAGAAGAEASRETRGAGGAKGRAGGRGSRGRRPSLTGKLSQRHRRGQNARPRGAQRRRGRTGAAVGETPARRCAGPRGTARAPGQPPRGEEVPPGPAAPPSSGKGGRRAGGGTKFRASAPPSAPAPAAADARPGAGGPGGRGRGGPPPARHSLRDFAAPSRAPTTEAPRETGSKRATETCCRGRGPREDGTALRAAAALRPPRGRPAAQPALTCRRASLHLPAGAARRLRPRPAPQGRPHSAAPARRSASGRPGAGGGGAPAPPSPGSPPRGAERYLQAPRPPPAPPSPGSPPAGRRAEAGRQGRGGGRSSEPLRGAGRGVRGAGSLRGAPRGQGPGRALAPHGCVLTRRRPHGDEDEDGRRTRPCAPQCFREKDGNGPARGGRSWPGAAGAQRSLLPPRRGRLPPGRRATSPALCFALEPPLPPVASVFVPARVEQGSFPAAPVQCPCAASAASSQFIWQNEGKL